ncbi:MAG: trypsin-like peptidase domain-containing protein [Oscillospiraceae bacterium]|nr:trypsin-like peptidase domain-containing protein [Oscillospiraceae bacterium]
MDNFDTQELNFEPEYNENQPQQPEAVNQSQPYSGAGAGRKESPFADSPYVMNHTRQNSYQSQYDSSYMPPVEPPKKKKKRSGSMVWKGVVAGLLAVALVASGCGITAALVNNYWENRTEELVGQVQVQIRDLQDQIIANANASAGNSVSGTVQLLEGLTPGQVYARNVKSVVLISSTVTESYFGQTASGTSSGSGFVLTEDGYVVTNHHVVEGASSISVTMSDGTVHPAQLVGSDSTNDVAVLKMDATGLQAVALGSSTDLIVGDQVVAIGNPLGELTSTMTVGYVSAKDRDVTTDNKTINMIQTDAAINSGNSGGPMFNMNGEVIGITTAKYSGESASGASIEGIGFAIPIDDVMPLIDDLINYGYVTGAYLGVMVSDMDAETASYYGLPVGAYVQEAVEGFCAKAAGVQAKDIIVAVGENEVNSVSDLTRALRKFKAGDTTTITVFRSGSKVVLDITLDEKPQDTNTQQPVNPDSSQMPQNGSYDEWYNYFAPFFGGGNG